MHTNVPGIDIAILVLSTNNEKTFRDLGSGFVVVKKNNKFREKLFKVENGGLCGDRTHDLMIKSHPLYQLS